MSLTDAELEERRQYLGGSDAPALAGMNPPGWAQPIDVWLEKRPDLAGDLLQPKRSSPLMGMGSLLEDDVAALFTAATGIPLRRYTRPVHSRRYPWMGGHLDRSTYGAIFEAKWQHTEKGFGPSQWVPELGGWVDLPLVIPPHYMLQVQHYLIVTNKPLAFVGLMLGYAEFRAYRVPADYGLQEHLIELERRFWHENVLPGIPPEPDGSESYGRVIAQRLQQDRGTELVATPELAEQMRLLKAVQADRKAAEQHERLIKQHVQLAMGDHASLVGSGFSASYRAHEVRTVDWKAVARRLIEDEATPEDDVEAMLAHAAAQHTTTTTQRPFKPKWDDEEDASYGTN